MARVASFVRPLADPDFGELEEMAAAHGLTVTINTIAQARGWPCVELHRPDDSSVRAVFRRAAQALEWLGQQDQGRP